MVPHVAERLVNLFANLSQFKTLEVKQLDRSALHLREIVKRRQQMREIKSHANFVLNVILPW